MKKKIAVICDYKLLSNRVGGMDYFFWEFDKKCKTSNIEIDWFFPNQANHGNYSDLTLLSPQNGQDLLPFVNQNLRQNNKEYTHIITHFVELCTSFFRDLKKLSKAKIYAVDHNPRPLKGYSIKKTFKKKVKGFLYSKYIDCFIGVSKYTTEEIIKDFGSHLKQRTRVIYNGVVINDIKTNTNRRIKGPKFIVACHLRKSKGVQDLIEAINKLEEDITKEIKIDIYGDGPYRGQLGHKVEGYKLSEVFQFKGSVSNLNEIYKNYDYMILPSHMECFSLAILESLAANVPVIASNVGGNEEAIDHESNGYIFKAQNAVELSQIIKDVFTSKKKITKNTRTEIENKYSLDKMVNAYFKLLT